MKSLILLSLVSSVTTSLFPTSSEKTKNRVDNYEYEFCSEKKFDKTNGDEFEILDFGSGGRSGSSSTDIHGNTKIEKESSLDQTLIPDNVGSSNCEAISYNDSRENNDDFETATNVYSVGHWEEGIYQHSAWLDATISQKTKGWWLWEEKYIDKDVYSFDACTYGTLTVTLSNIPTNCDYDLRAYRLEDGTDAKASSLSFDKYIAISNNSSNTSEKIILSVKPGTYYFYVYSYQEKTYDNDNPYHLLFEELVDESRANTHYNITEGKSKGDIGAIWVSDYKPLGYTPVTLKNSDAKVSFSNYNDYPYIRDLANKYNGDDYINYAVIYVWDLQLKAAISAMAGLLVQQIEKTTDWEDYTQRNVSIWINGLPLLYLWLELSLD